MKLTVQMTVNHRVMSRKIKLPECPSPGDAITIWPKKKKKGGLIVTVRKKHWANKLQPPMVLVCDTQAEVNEEYLSERGWK